MIKISVKGNKGKYQVKGDKELCNDQIEEMIWRILRDQPMLIYPILSGILQNVDRNRLVELVDYVNNGHRIIYPDFTEVAE